MGKINEKKLEEYTDKLYRGDLARYKVKLKKDDTYSVSTFYRDKGMIERKTISESTKKVVLDKYYDRCDICKKPYDEYYFIIHRIDGDRDNLMETNLVPLCLSCHKEISALAKAKLNDYKVEIDRMKTENKYGIPDIKSIKI